MNAAAYWLLRLSPAPALVCAYLVQIGSKCADLNRLSSSSVMTMSQLSRTCFVAAYAASLLRALSWAEAEAAGAFGRCVEVAWPNWWKVSSIRARWLRPWFSCMALLRFCSNSLNCSCALASAPALRSDCSSASDPDSDVDDVSTYVVVCTFSAESYGLRVERSRGSSAADISAAGAPLAYIPAFDFFCKLSDCLSCSALSGIMILACSCNW